MSNGGEKTPPSAKGKLLTALQQHILFWDPDNGSILWPSDIYSGFRALGFNIPFSIFPLLIPLYFSYPTTLGTFMVSRSIFPHIVTG
jgi:peroxygenase